MADFFGAVAVQVKRNRTREIGIDGEPRVLNPCGFWRVGSCAGRPVGDDDLTLRMPSGRLRGAGLKASASEVDKGKCDSLDWPPPERRMTPRLSPTPRTVSLREHAASPGGRQNGFQKTALLHSFVCGRTLYPHLDFRLN